MNNYDVFGLLTAALLHNTGLVFTPDQFSLQWKEYHHFALYSRRTAVATETVLTL